MWESSILTLSLVSVQTLHCTRKLGGHCYKCKAAVDAFFFSAKLIE
jgi:hypothetical protein